MTDTDTSNDELAKRIATSVRERMEESSRRSFLSKSALTGGSLLAIGGTTGAVLATDEHETDEAGNESQAPGNESVAMGEEPMFDDVEGTDIDVLNYALSLEHLENAFYRQGMEMFSEEDFVDAEPLQRFTEEHRQAAYGYIETVGEHEAAHVDVLTQAVELLGGEPAAEATYEFGVESVGDFLNLAAVLENTGVAAYAGAGTYIESPDLQSAALSIHSVEARHAAVLNMLAGDPPFPEAFDPALSQEEVLEAVSEFIVSDGDDGDGTDTGTDNGTDMETDNGTDMGTDNGTDMGTDDGTDVGTVVETDDDSGMN